MIRAIGRAAGSLVWIWLFLVLERFAGFEPTAITLLATLVLLLIDRDAP